MVKFAKFDAADYLDSEETIAEFLTAALEDEDGAFYVFRKVGLDHYKTNDSSNTGVSVGLLAMNEIFNPNAKPRYTIEKQLEEREEVEVMSGWTEPNQKDS